MIPIYKGEKDLKRPQENKNGNTHFHNEMEYSE